MSQEYPIKKERGGKKVRMHLHDLLRRSKSTLDDDFAFGRIRQRRALDQLGKDLLHLLRLRRYTAHPDRDRRLGKAVRGGGGADRADDEVETAVSRQVRVHPDERDRTTVAR